MQGGPGPGAGGRELPGDSGAVEQDLLAAARSGRAEAFDRLVAPYRPALRAHCYRMLGTVPDADDAVQETLLRAWRGLERFESRSSVRSWLYTIATNASLRLAEQRSRRVLPVDLSPGGSSGGSSGEVAWLEPFPDADLPADAVERGADVGYELRESVELAFTAALQHLPARQRATLILRDVLGFTARETAEVLGTSAASIDSTMQRARATVRDRVPARSQQRTARDLGDRAVRDIVDRFAAAWQDHDVDALVSMLAEDARFAMPPEAGWFAGREAVAAFLRARPLAAGTSYRMSPTSANGQPALATYVWSARSERYEAESLVVLTLDGDRVREITAFRSPDLFRRFMLPVSR